MKKTTIQYLATWILLFGLTFTFSQCDSDIPGISDKEYSSFVHRNKTPNSDHTKPDNASKDICSCLTTTFPAEELSSEEIEALLYMREEEKLARDVYLFLYEKWDFRVFNNISNSEAKHMEAVKCLIDRYELADPVEEDVKGIFTNETLAYLYDSLTTAGSASLEQALGVGAFIEDVDIHDLLGHLADEAIDNTDVKAVFENLTKGSRNHMRAFVKNLAERNIAYTPTFIDEAYFNEIINSERERGGGVCQGSGDCGNGQSGKKGNCDGNGSKDGKNGQGGEGKGDCTNNPQNNKNGGSKGKGN